MSHLLGIPDVYNNFYDSTLRYELHPDTYFVFGSNLAGRHGKGAAFDALAYGATYGVGMRFSGQSYAIPTKDISIRTLPLEVIKRFVTEFVNLTNEEEGKHFFVTAVGTGLAGYKHSDIAPLFKGAKNCWFPLEWKPYVDCHLPIVYQPTVN